MGAIVSSSFPEEELQELATDADRARFHVLAVKG